MNFFESEVTFPVYYTIKLFEKEDEEVLKTVMILELSESI